MKSPHHFDSMKDRYHFVFVKACGCPIGLTEMRAGVRTEDEAWDNFYDTRGEERAARTAGVHVELVDHPVYVDKFYARMAVGCTHGGSA